MKKFLTFMLVFFVSFSIEAKNGYNNYKHNNKPAKPAGISPKHVRPSWMIEKEISINNRNPYTGKTSKHKWVSAETRNEAHQYLSTICFTTCIGTKYIECPYYANKENGNVKGSILPSFDFNVMYTFGGNLKNNFGVFAGFDYVCQPFDKYCYNRYPQYDGLIMDYRFGISIMKYAAIGFQIEHNTYYREYIQDAYRIDQNHYGFYVMGLYRLGHHIGLDVNFSYIFNDQWNRYNSMYDKSLYAEKHPIMTDFSIHVGLIYYVQIR